jgi:hypothetical protein
LQNNLAAFSCVVSDTIDTGERSDVSALSWEKMSYGDASVTFSVRSKAKADGAWSGWVTVDNPGDTPEGFAPGRYLQWAAAFKYSSNPHGSILGSLWVEHKPKPITLNAVIGLKVQKDDEIVWYAKDSLSPGHLIKSYAWDFDGDAVTDSDKGIDRWPYASSADVTLTVSDDTPASDSITFPVEVV